MPQTFGDNACHPEPFASLKGKLREGSGSTDAEILRCAQDDSQDTTQVRSSLISKRLPMPECAGRGMCHMLYFYRHIHMTRLMESLAMKLARKLPLLADSFYDVHMSVIEAFLFYVEKQEMCFYD